MADRTHLHRAAQRGDIGAVRALVQAVDVNLRGGWRVESPLHAASRSGRPDVIACLVDAGAHTEVRDRNNDTPLLLAAWLGHAAAISKLLASGARVDADGIPRSALHCACMQGHAGCVTELLRGGADENVEDEDGNTPAEVIGTMSESLERAEDVALIREMLRRAPADRSWRRRGWLVMLRARDCVLSIPPLPMAVVTTRSSAKRGTGFFADVRGGGSSGGGGGGGGRIFAGPMSPRSSEGQGQTVGDQQQEQKKKVVGTRGKNQGTRQVSVSGDRCGERDASPKRSSVAGGGEACPPGKAKRFNKKAGRGPAKSRGRKGGRRRRGEGENESEKAVANRKALADLVARLIALGEEGAFRCVLTFL